ncbi:alpha/beta hydrolase-fold protein [Sporolactobacillus sp. Y61]|uniref:Alpha/beta hydrolase-fold protein n=1 Tax=Sporolactobacillus sp. Y61 TaxID=3160863 RepID=A0AAU8IIP2_9BACL
MALMTTRFYSETLQLDTTVNIIIPDKLQKDHPLAVLYLLHGLSDDSSTWLMHSSVLRYAENRPFLIIMPDVHRSFYTDMAFGNHYWTYLTKELPEKVNLLPLKWQASFPYSKTQVLFTKQESPIRMESTFGERISHLRDHQLEACPSLKQRG